VLWQASADGLASAIPGVDTVQFPAEGNFEQTHERSPDGRLADRRTHEQAMVSEEGALAYWRRDSSRMLTTRTGKANDLFTLSTRNCLQDLASG